MMRASSAHVVRSTASASAYKIGEFCWAAVSSTSAFCAVLVLTEHRSIAENAAKRYADSERARTCAWAWYPQACVRRVKVVSAESVQILPEITRERFERLRAKCMKARDAYLAECTKAAIKYENVKFAPQKKLDVLRTKQDAAFDAMFELLEASPRDWRSGVPLHWVVLDLPYEDAVRPANEPLSITPPKAFGSLQAKQ